jgi:hypothetical protein
MAHHLVQARLLAEGSHHQLQTPHDIAGGVQPYRHSDDLG